MKNVDSAAGFNNRFQCPVVGAVIDVSHILQNDVEELDARPLAPLMTKKQTGSHLSWLASSSLSVRLHDSLMMIEFAADLMRRYTFLDVEQHPFSGRDEHGAAMVMPGQQYSNAFTRPWTCSPHCSRA